MCNLHAMTRKDDDLARFLRVSHNRRAAFQPVNAIFPRHVAPVVRYADDGERETFIRLEKGQRPSPSPTSATTKSRRTHWCRRLRSAANVKPATWRWFAIELDFFNVEAFATCNCSSDPYAIEIRGQTTALACHRKPWSMVPALDLLSHELAASEVRVGGSPLRLRMRAASMSSCNDSAVYGILNVVKSIEKFISGGLRMSIDTSEFIAAYGAGTASLDSLQSCVASAWEEILTSPAERVAAAKALGVNTEEIEHLPEAPVKLETGQGGLGAVEFAVMVSLWLAQDILLDSFKDLAKEEIKKRVKQLWLDVIEPIVRRNLPDRHSLGPRSDPE